MTRTTLVLVLLSAACSGPGQRQLAQTAPLEIPSPAEAAEAQRLGSEQALAALFPELAPELARGGEITREGIEALLARSGGAAAAGTEHEPTLEPVRAALAAGDLDTAHAQLTALVLERRLADARARLADGSARAALVLAERALAIAPGDAGALLVRGEAALALAEPAAGMHDEPACEIDVELLARALDDLVRAAEAGAGARAWIAASDAARQLGETERAIELARRALPRPGTTVEASIALGARRALAEASLDAHAAERRTGDTARADELYRTTHTTLSELIERRPDDPSGFLLAARLERQAGAPDAARQALLAGLARSPSDAALHAALYELLRERDDAERLAATYAALREAHPDAVLALWYPAVDRFERALAALARGEDASAAFGAAEDDFADCAVLDPARAETSLEHQILCRSGSGWSLLAIGDLEGAHDAFLLMDELAPGHALTRALDGRLASGVQGLSEVADASARLGRDVNSLERADHMERASKVFDCLHEYEPRELRWAVATGAQNRDTAILFEQRARALARQGDTPQANQLLTRARELMEHSFRAYVDATELAPDDLAALSETGTLLTNYLQRDAPLAESTLLRAVEAGAKRLSAARAALVEPGLDDAERTRRQRALEVLEIALGDVYQDLGVLNLTLERDPRSARTWFRRALDEGGPDPRPEIEAWLARCDAAEAGSADANVRDKNRWAAPIAP